VYINAVYVKFYPFSKSLTASFARVRHDFVDSLLVPH